MECQENGRTMWWKPKALLEVTTIKLGWDGEKWNDPCWVLWTPLGEGVGKIDGIIVLLSLLTSLVVCRVWFKITSTKASKEGILITFSFNFPFPLEAIFCLPPSTCVFAKLARISMKEGLIFSFKGISKVGVLFFGQLKYQPHWKRWGASQSLSKSLWNIMLSTLGSHQLFRKLESWSMAPWNNKTW